MTLIKQILFTFILTLSIGTNTFAESLFAPVSDEQKQQIIVQDKPIDVIVKPWQGRKQRGSAIILGPTESDATGLESSRYMRLQLPLSGWATISIKPTEGLYRPNFATDADQINKAGEKQLTLDAHQMTPKYTSSQLLELNNFQQKVIEESIAQIEGVAAQYPGKRIIIAADDSAGMVVNLLHQDKLTKPDLLVIINPYREFEQLIDEQNRGLSIAKQLAGLDIPVLDLQSANGHKAALAQSIERKNSNLVKSANLYRQYLLQLDLSHQGGWDEALDHIEGFARKIAGY
ncbi:MULTISPECIES: DUF3530 family protein [Shewanella]|uniref:DUF3530 family protein n=1 Tax=Shewanella TaxID=22 RepID=UPI0006D675B3|nr:MULTISPECIES: DUF3530 family protein [Shewanella]KPZ73609.1 hypothetical protein AN944_00194 [Shewanella sp. P1-14-1]